MKKKQIIIILLLSTALGMLRYIFIEDSDFTLIKKERVIEKVDSFIIPDDIAGPMVVDLEFSKYYFDQKSAIFIDARDPEDYNVSHIKNSINIPYDSLISLPRRYLPIFSLFCLLECMSFRKIRL